MLCWSWLGGLVPTTIMMTRTTVRRSSTGQMTFFFGIVICQYSAKKSGMCWHDKVVKENRAVCWFAVIIQLSTENFYFKWQKCSQNFQLGIIDLITEPWTLLRTPPSLNFPRRARNCALSPWTGPAIRRGSLTCRHGWENSALVEIPGPFCDPIIGTN